MKEDIRQKNWKKRKKNGIWRFTCALIAFTLIYGGSQIKPDNSNTSYAVQTIIDDNETLYFGSSDNDRDEIVRSPEKTSIKIQKFLREDGKTIDWIVEYNPKFNDWHKVSGPRMILLLPSDAKLIGNIDISSRSNYSESYSNDNNKISKSIDTWINSDNYYEAYAYKAGERSEFNLKFGSYIVDTIGPNAAKQLYYHKDKGKFSYMLTYSPGLTWKAFQWKFTTKVNDNTDPREVAVSAVIERWHNGKFARGAFKGPIDSNYDGKADYKITDEKKASEKNKIEEELAKKKNQIEDLDGISKAGKAKAIKEAENLAEEQKNAVDKAVEDAKNDATANNKFVYEDYQKSYTPKKNESNIDKAINKAIEKGVTAVQSLKVDPEQDKKEAKEEAIVAIDQAVKDRTNAINSSDSSKKAKDDAIVAINQVTTDAKEKVDQAINGAVAEEAGENGVKAINEVNVKTPAEELQEAKDLAKAEIDKAVNDKKEAIKNANASQEAQNMNNLAVDSIAATKKTIVENSTSPKEAEKAGKDGAKAIADIHIQTEAEENDAKDKLDKLKLAYEAFNDAKKEVEGDDGVVGREEFERKDFNTLKTTFENSKINAKESVDKLAYKDNLENINLLDESVTLPIVNDENNNHIPDNVDELINNVNTAIMNAQTKKQEFEAAKTIAGEGISQEEFDDLTLKKQAFDDAKRVANEAKAKIPTKYKHIKIKDGILNENIKVPTVNDINDNDKSDSDDLEKAKAIVKIASDAKKKYEDAIRNPGIINEAKHTGLEKLKNDYEIARTNAKNYIEATRADGKGTNLPVIKRNETGYLNLTDVDEVPSINDENNNGIEDDVDILVNEANRAIDIAIKAKQDFDNSKITAGEGISQKEFNDLIDKKNAFDIAKQNVEEAKAKVIGKYKNKIKDDSSISGQNANLVVPDVNDENDNDIADTKDVANANEALQKAKDALDTFEAAKEVVEGDDKVVSQEEITSQDLSGKKDIFDNAKTDAQKAVDQVPNSKENELINKDVLNKTADLPEVNDKNNNGINDSLELDKIKKEAVKEIDDKKNLSTEEKDKFKTDIENAKNEQEIADILDKATDKDVENLVKKQKEEELNKSIADANSNIDLVAKTKKESIQESAASIDDKKLANEEVDKAVIVAKENIKNAQTVVDVKKAETDGIKAINDVKVNLGSSIDQGNLGDQGGVGDEGDSGNQGGIGDQGNY